MGFATYGGRINTVPSNATASGQRDSILDMACTTGCLDPQRRGEESGVGARVLSGSVCRERGVPMPGEAYDGALINHSDIDLADPTLNTSGVPWHQLYYKTNYPRLQRIKARWDPRDVFQHALSIRMR